MLWGSRRRSIALADPEYTDRTGQKIGGYRTVLGVPLMRDGLPVVLHRAIGDGDEPGGAARMTEVAAVVAGGRPGSTTTRVPTRTRL
jgi:hypothetical protein